MKKSMSLEFDPSSEPPLISAKQLFLRRYLVSIMGPGVSHLLPNFLPELIEKLGLPPAQPQPRMQGYRGTSLIRNTPRLGPYSRTIPRVIWWS